MWSADEGGERREEIRTETIRGMALAGRVLKAVPERRYFVPKDERDYGPFRALGGPNGEARNG